MHRIAKAGDVLSSLADIFRGSSAKQEHKEVGQQTDPDILVALCSAAAQIEVTKSSPVESPIVLGTACLAADVMQTEYPVPSDAPLPSDQDAFLSAATDAVAGQAPPRHRNRHRHDALLNSAITSVAQERRELANNLL